MIRLRAVPGAAHPGQGNRRSLAYVPAIDGLRALAVLAVLFYHAHFDWMPGGFLGVEVFFVISGYLVTSLLLAEHRRAHRIDLLTFWRRRFWRLYPASATAIVATLGYTAIFLPGELAALRPEALSALALGSNWEQLSGDGSYFAAFGRPSLVRHFWSLGVEWQFYLVWPIVAVVALRFVGRSGLAVIAAVIGAGSALLMVAHYSPETDPSRVYYGTDTRLSGLMAGALIAVLWTEQVRARFRPAAVRALEGCAAAALAYLVFACAAVHELDRSLYQGGFVVVGLATAVVVLAATHPQAGLIRTLLGARPLAWAGLRSYSLYLWHWPVFMLTRPGTDIDLGGGWLIALRFGLALTLAELSYRFVEEPFRRGWRPWRTSAWTNLVHGRQVRWSTTMVAVSAAAVLGGGATALATVVATAHQPGLPSYLPTESVHEVYTPVPGGPTPVPPAPSNTPTPGTAPSPTPTSTSTPASSPSATATPTNEPSAAPTPSPTATPSPHPETSTTEPSPSSSSTAEPTQNSPSPSATPEPTTPPLTATPDPAPAGGISALGDSVMLGAAPWLPASLGAVTVDASIARQLSAGIDTLRAWRDSGTLGGTVIIHLGNNGIFTDAHFDQIMEIAGDRHVVFVTLVVPRAWEDGNNATIRAGVARYANASLTDWNSYASGSSEYFVEDGIHLTPAGAQAYAALIASAVGY